MQITYRELAIAIESMTKDQRSKPFKVFEPINAVYHPFTEDHCILGSRLTKELPFQDPDYVNFDQYFIEDVVPKNEIALTIQLRSLQESLQESNELEEIAKEEIPRIETELMLLLLGVERDEVEANKMETTRLTYDELYLSIKEMSDKEKDCPVKFYSHLYYDVFPDDQSYHPDYAYNSKLILHENDQPVFTTFLSPEGEDKGKELYFRKLLLKPDISPDFKSRVEKMVKERWG